MKRIRTRYIYLWEVILVALAIILSGTDYADWGGVCLIIVFFLSCVTKYREEKKAMENGENIGIKPLIH
jgi:hypothetical protein